MVMKSSKESTGTDSLASIRCGWYGKSTLRDLIRVWSHGRNSRRDWLMPDKCEASRLCNMIGERSKITSDRCREGSRSQDGYG